MIKTTEDSVLAYVSQGLGVYNSREAEQQEKEARSTSQPHRGNKESKQEVGGAKSPQSQLPLNDASSTKVPCPKSFITSTNIATNRRPRV